MSNVNGRILHPVSTDDVKTVLGLGPQGNDVGYLCSNTHGKINKWSKYKPIRRSEIFCQDIDPSAPNYVERWWWGEDYKCGLNFSIDNPLGVPVKSIYQTRSNYAYLAPSINLGNPLRLGDFSGYYHGAQPPIKTWITQGQVDQYDLIGTDLKINFGITGVTESYSLKWSDFGLGTYYFTVYVYDEYGTEVAIVRSTTPYNDFGDNVEWIVSNTSFQQTFDVYYVLTDNDNHIFTIPWDQDNYFMKKVRTVIRTRVLRAVGLYTNSVNGWYDLTTQTGNLNGNPSPRLRIMVERIPQSITFNNSTTYFKTETSGSDGRIYTSIGKLSSETGANIPGSVTIPGAQSGTDYVYYEFAGAYPPVQNTSASERVYMRLLITYDSGVNWTNVDSFTVITR